MTEQWTTHCCPVTLNKAFCLTISAAISGCFHSWCSCQMMQQRRALVPFLGQVFPLLRPLITALWGFLTLNRLDTSYFSHYWESDWKYSLAEEWSGEKEDISLSVFYSTFLKNILRDYGRDGLPDELSQRSLDTARFCLLLLFWLTVSFCLTWVWLTAFFQLSFAWTIHSPSLHSEPCFCF